MSANPDSTQAESRTTTPASARQARTVALVIGLLSLLLIGAFVSMIFFVQDEVPLHAVGPVAPGPGAEHGGLVFQGKANIWTVNGRLGLDTARTVRVNLDFTSATGEPAPAGLPLELKLDRSDRDTSAIPLPHAVVASGSYIASAQVPEAGRWRLRIELPQVTGVFAFDVSD